MKPITEQPMERFAGRVSSAFGSARRFVLAPFQGAETDEGALFRGRRSQGLALPPATNSQAFSLKTYGRASGFISLVARRSIIVRCAAAAAGLLALTLPCCGPHTIQGRVIEGDASFVTVVDKDDHRLDSKHGVSDVLLKLQLEPGRINRRQIAQETSDRDGYFRLPVDEFGAGVIDLEGGLLARRRGFRSAEGVFKIPGDSRWILIILAPGRDTPGTFEEEPSVQEQVERFK